MAYKQEFTEAEISNFKLIVRDWLRVCIHTDKSFADWLRFNYSGPTLARFIIWYNKNIAEGDFNFEARKNGL